MEERPFGAYPHPLASAARIQADTAPCRCEHAVALLAPFGAFGAGRSLAATGGDSCRRDTQEPAHLHAHLAGNA